MGTNYYTKKRNKNMHIGKSSMGWQFLFQGYKEFNLNSKEDWIKYLIRYKKKIYNEYDEEVSLEEFKEMIVFKSPYNKLLLSHYDECEKSNRLEEYCIKDKDNYTILYNDFR